MPERGIKQTAAPLQSNQRAKTRELKQGIFLF
jgi:hypothetical protein